MGAPRKGATLDAAVELIAAHPGIRVPELHARLKATPKRDAICVSIVYRLVADLRDDGRIEYDDIRDGWVAVKPRASAASRTPGAEDADPDPTRDSRPRSRAGTRSRSRSRRASAAR